MPSQGSGNPKAWGLGEGSILGQNLQLAEHQIPVLITPFPVLHNSLRSQVQYPAQEIIIGERGLVFGDLAKLAIEPFDDIRRIYDFPNLGWVFEKGAQNFPVFLF